MHAIYLDKKEFIACVISIRLNRSESIKHTADLLRSIRSNSIYAFKIDDLVRDIPKSLKNIRKKLNNLREKGDIINVRSFFCNYT